jgi:hypothetical protein
VGSVSSAQLAAVDHFASPLELSQVSAPHVAAGSIATAPAAIVRSIKPRSPPFLFTLTVIRVRPSDRLIVTGGRASSRCARG